MTHKLQKGVWSARQHSYYTKQFLEYSVFLRVENGGVMGCQIHKLSETEKVRGRPQSARAKHVTSEIRRLAVVSVIRVVPEKK